MHAVAGAVWVRSVGAHPVCGYPNAESVGDESVGESVGDIVSSRRMQRRYQIAHEPNALQVLEEPSPGRELSSEGTPVPSASSEVLRSETPGSATHNRTSTERE